MTAIEENTQTIRHKIAIQIVKARVPGLKHTRGELNDEASLVPDVYIDNILAILSQQHEREIAIDEKYLLECFEAVVQYTKHPAGLGGMKPETALFNYKNLRGQQSNGGKTL